MVAAFIDKYQLISFAAIEKPNTTSHVSEFGETNAADWSHALIFSGLYPALLQLR